MGRLFYPSNSSDGDWFESKFCNKCYKKYNCTILINAYFGKHPKQWVYNDKNDPECTSFNPNKPKRDKKDNIPTLF